MATLKELLAGKTLPIEITRRVWGGKYFTVERFESLEDKTYPVFTVIGRPSKGSSPVSYLDRSDVNDWELYPWNRERP